MRGCGKTTWGWRGVVMALGLSRVDVWPAGCSATRLALSLLRSLIMLPPRRVSNEKFNGVGDAVKLQLLMNLDGFTIDVIMETKE